MVILLAIGLAFGENINWSINGKVLYIKTEKSHKVESVTILSGSPINWDIDLSPTLSNYQSHITINFSSDEDPTYNVTARIVIDDAIIQQNLKAFSVFLGSIEIDNVRETFVVTNYNSSIYNNSIIDNYISSNISYYVSNYLNSNTVNYKNQTLTWVLSWDEFYALNISYYTITFIIYSQNFNESGSIEANESVSKNYTIDNPQQINPGGLHMTINSSRNGSIVIAKVETDLGIGMDSTGEWNSTTTGYYSYGAITINGIPKSFTLSPGGKRKLFWQQIIKAPIPSIAIALILITIPIIALRKLN